MDFNTRLSFGDVPGQRFRGSHPSDFESAPPAPARVEVPVMVPCVGEVPERPAYEFDKLPATATDGEIVLVLARDWSRGRKYESALEIVITGCL